MSLIIETKKVHRRKARRKGKAKDKPAERTKRIACAGLLGKMITDLTQMRDGTEMTREIGMTLCQVIKEELEVLLRRCSTQTTTMTLDKAMSRAAAEATTDRKVIDTEDHQLSLRGSMSVLNMNVPNITTVEVLQCTPERNLLKDQLGTNSISTAEAA